MGKGAPHNTVIVMRWMATDPPAYGVPDQNHGVHAIRMKWGKVVRIDAHEDSQAVAERLRRLAEMAWRRRARRRL